MNSIDTYHAEHETGMDPTCSACTTFAILAIVQDLFRSDAVRAIEEARATLTGDRD